MQTASGRSYNGTHIANTSDYYKNRLYKSVIVITVICVSDLICGRCSTHMYSAEARNVIMRHNKSEPLFLYMVSTIPI